MLKTLKLYYKDKGKDPRYPKDVFKEAFNDSLIEDEAVFLKILEDRNKTVHIYSQEDIEAIYRRIVDLYCGAFSGLLRTLSGE